MMMLLEVESNVVDSAGMGAKSAFNIKASAHAFRMLSSGLYSNKIRAALREIGCNAADAHIMAGKKDLPFEVHLPSRLSNKFYIKDFGPGLDPDEIRDLYTTYFSSSKQQSNEVTGAFGLGSKSPFAYTDSFTITSAKNGVTTTYVAYLDEASAPAIRVVTSFPSDSAWPNGVQIGMAVKPHDVQTFLNEAQHVYQFFAVLPTMVNSAQIQRRKYSIETVDFALPVSGDPLGMLVVMGNVAYPLPMAEAVHGLSNNYTMESIFRRLNPEIRVPIGAVSVAASREHLEFTPQTQATIKKIAEKLLGNFADQYWEKVKDLKFDTFAAQKESHAKLQALGIEADVLRQLLKFNGKWTQDQQDWISRLLSYKSPKIRVPDPLSKTMKLAYHFLGSSRGGSSHRVTSLDLVLSPTEALNVGIFDKFAVLIPGKTKFMRERLNHALKTGIYNHLFVVSEDEAESLRIAKEWCDMPVVYGKDLPLPATFVPPSQRRKVPKAPKVEPTFEYVDVVTGVTQQLQISQVLARGKYFIEYSSTWGRRTYALGRGQTSGLSNLVQGLATLHPHCSLIPDGFFALTDRRIELLGLRGDPTWNDVSTVGKTLLTPMIRDLVNREPEASVGRLISDGSASDYNSPLRFLACHAKANSELWKALQTLRPGSPLLNAALLHAAGKSSKNTPVSLDEYNGLIHEFGEWASKMTQKPAPAEHSQAAYPTFHSALSYHFPNNLVKADAQLAALIISHLIARDEQQLPTTIDLLAA